MIVFLYVFRTYCTPLCDYFSVEFLDSARTFGSKPSIDREERHFRSLYEVRTCIAGRVPALGRNDPGLPVPCFFAYFYDTIACKKYQYHRSPRPIGRVSSAHWSA